MPVEIQNRGPDIIATDYFTSRDARAGFAYISLSDRCWRVLLPEVLLDELYDMRSCTRAEVERTRLGMRIWFLGPDKASTAIEVARQRGDVDRGPVEPEEEDISVAIRSRARHPDRTPVTIRENPERIAVSH